jgi:hypothetical protein
MLFYFAITVVSTFVTCSGVNSSNKARVILIYDTSNPY